MYLWCIFRFNLHSMSMCGAVNISPQNLGQNLSIASCLVPSIGSETRTNRRRHHSSPPWQQLPPHLMYLTSLLDAALSIEHVALWGKSGRSWGCCSLCAKCVTLLSQTTRRRNLFGEEGYYFLKKNLNAPRPSEHPPVAAKFKFVVSIFFFVCNFISFYSM